MKGKGGELLPVLRAAHQHKRDLVDRLARTQPTAAETTAMRHASRRRFGGEVN